MSKPFISIVLSAYNAAKFVEQTLTSLLHQTFRNYEIIAVDDGSTDDTKKKLDRYSDRMTIIAQSHQGPEGARNAGIECAQGKYIVSFDADDILFPYALEVYAVTIEKFGRPQLILGDMSYFESDSPVQRDNWDGSTVRCTESLCFFKRRNSLDVSNSNTIARRDVLIKVNGYQLNSFLYDDLCLLFRLGTQSPFLVIEYPTTVARRSHDANFSSNPKVLLRGAMAICSSERSELFPGGNAMRMDRRGLIASNLAANILRLALRTPCVSKLQKSATILRILLTMRLFLFSGIVRLLCKRTYFRKEYEFKSVKEIPLNDPAGPVLEQPLKYADKNERRIAAKFRA